MKTDPAKTQAVADWPCPASQKQLGFLGFVNLYSKVAAPPSWFTATSSPYTWTPKTKTAFLYQARFHLLPSSCTLSLHSNLWLRWMPLTRVAWCGWTIRTYPPFGQPKYSTYLPYSRYFINMASHGALIHIVSFHHKFGKPCAKPKHKTESPLPAQLPGVCSSHLLLCLQLNDYTATGTSPFWTPSFPEEEVRRGLFVALLVCMEVYATLLHSSACSWLPLHPCTNLFKRAGPLGL